MPFPRPPWSSLTSTSMEQACRPSSRPGVKVVCLASAGGEAAGTRAGPDVSQGITIRILCPHPERDRHARLHSTLRAFHRPDLRLLIDDDLDAQVPGCRGATRALRAVDTAGCRICAGIVTCEARHSEVDAHRSAGRQLVPKHGRSPSVAGQMALLESDLDDLKFGSAAKRMKDAEREFTTEQDFDCRQRSGVFADAKPGSLQARETLRDTVDVAAHLP
jgi:hypothetical protein